MRSDWDICEVDEAHALSYVLGLLTLETFCCCDLCCVCGASKSRNSGWCAGTSWFIYWNSNVVKSRSSSLNTPPPKHSSMIKSSRCWDCFRRSSIVGDNSVSCSLELHACTKVFPIVFQRLPPILIKQWFVCACIFVCVCVNVWMCECVNVWMCECVNVWMCVCVYVCMCVCVYVCMCVCVYVCMCVCVYISVLP